MKYFNVKTIVVSVIAVFFISTASWAAVIGSDVAEGKTYTYPGDRALGMVVSPTEDVTINTMYAHVLNVRNSTVIRGVVYQKPTEGGNWNLIAVTGIEDISYNWNTLTFPESVTLETGSTYLLAHITDGIRSVYYGDGGHHGGGRIWNANVDFQNPEADHPVQLAYIYSAYADFVPTDVPEEEPVEEPVEDEESLTSTEALDLMVEDLGLAYDPTGAVHAYPNILKKGKDGRLVVFEGYVVDKLAALREGHNNVIKEVYITVDDLQIDVDLNDADFEVSARVPAVPGTEMSVSLYAIDIFDNLVMVDSTRIKVRGIHPCTQIANMEKRLERIKAKTSSKCKKSKCKNHDKGKGHKYGHGNSKADKRIKKIEARIAKLTPVCEGLN